MTLGLSSDRVALVREHRAWADEFVRERQRILDVLGSHIMAIEHVGSTSLPAVPAKPILYIQVGVQSFEDASVCIQPMESLGYEYRGEYGIDRRHYFVKGNPRTHHVHMLETSGEHWRSMLAFRDALLADPDLAREYADAKIDLAATYRDNRDGYQQAKGRLIERILTRSSPGAEPIE